MQITTRRATLNDLDELLNFEQGIISAERPFGDTLKEGEIHYYDLADYVIDPGTAVVVAEADGIVVGSGYARIVDSKPFLTHRQHCHLGFMYVKPQYRGRGVNNAILNSLKEWALERNVPELRLNVYAENQSAIKAYEKAGFSANLVEMRMELKK